MSSLAQNQSIAPYEPHAEYHSQTVGLPSEQPTGYAAPQQVDYTNSQQLYTLQHTSQQFNYTSQSHSSAVTQNGTYSQYAYNPYASGIPSRVMSSSAASGTQTGPSPKDVNAYRPATLNAYDPPIPSKVRSKARSAFYTPHPPPAIPNGVHYQYTGIVQSPSSLPPPPPPAIGARGITAPPTSYSASEQSLTANEILHGLSSSN